MARTNTAKLSTISLFSGTGGLDLGLEAAGFDIRVALELDADCVATLRHNRNWPVINRSIHEVPSTELLKVAGLHEGAVDLLVGGPPCQPFSKSGYWASGDTKRLDDPRASTLEAFLRILRDLKPRAYLLENVAGLAYSGKDEGLRFLTETIRSINKECGTKYGTEILLLNAVDFGVPQIRERTFLIGSREGVRFGKLKPTHHPNPIGNHPHQLRISPVVEMYRTAWDAIGDLSEDGAEVPSLSGKWADLLPSIPEGSNYLFHTEKGGGLPLFGWRRRFWNFLLKLAKDLPSWTITASPGPATGPFHWNNRRLTVRELCRLQTIPDDYSILGTYRSALRQIGNAVPSALAEVIGLQIRLRLLADLSAASLKPSLIPPKSCSTPPPEPVAPVPSKFLHYVGKHAPHPGTGKGNRSRRQQQQPDLDIALE
ncbi:DNA cytosine methyltransferase [Desulforhabdus sp. TSK]|uniref:DNA cytosine methyltransferase n=1 Tax=Desulforhabdus sp. TSK TaxID=2925014 RepID=UPI002085BE58|nr:cytosine-specific methyltransferase [Desulforhabdus sp. TSK]